MTGDLHLGKEKEVKKVCGGRGAWAERTKEGSKKGYCRGVGALGNGPRSV